MLNFTNKKQRYKYLTDVIRKYQPGGELAADLSEIERMKQLDLTRNLQNVVPINSYTATANPNQVNPISMGNSIIQQSNDTRTQTVPSEVPSYKPLRIGFNPSNSPFNFQYEPLNIGINSSNASGYSPFLQQNNKTSEIPSENNFNTNLVNTGKDLLSTIAPTQQLLLGASRLYADKKKQQSEFKRMQDQDFNPSFQHAENDYGYKKGGKFQDGGDYEDDFDAYDFLFGDETEQKIKENEQEIEQNQIQDQIDQEEQEQNELAMQIAMDDSYTQRQPQEETYSFNEEYGNYGSPSNVNPSGNLLAKAIDYRNYAMSLGLSKTEASGLIGNGIVESNLNSTVLGTADDKGSRGLFQPHSERLTALKRYAASKGKDWRDPYVQIEQAVRELNTTHKKARGNFSSATDAARAVMNHFEKPAEWAKKQSFGQRAGYAEKLMQYQLGGEYDLTQDQIDELISKGYKIKYK